MENEITFYEVAGYPSYFAKGMPRRRINEKQIRTAIARVIEKMYKNIGRYDSARIDLKNHVAYFSVNEEEKRIHYRVTQYSQGSPYPWYSIGENKLNELINDGVEKMVCLYFDSSQEVTGSRFDLYYRIVRLEDVRVDRDSWKVEDKNHGKLYRWNPTKSYKSFMDKIESVAAKGERGELNEVHEI